MSNDQQCLESTKAQKIAQSQALVGIIRKNINNTLHDRSAKLVHIPIIELQPEQFDLMQNYLSNSSQNQLSIIIDFTHHRSTHQINLQIWLSPTQPQMYNLLLQLQHFLLKANGIVSVQPHYMLHYQHQRKSYLGCISSGRYCPYEMQWQSRIQGVGIVQQTLRQIIINKISQQKWWKYIIQYNERCLPKINELLTRHSALQSCSQNCMLIADVDIKLLRQEYMGSFEGSGRQLVDNNVYLLQERQIYISQHQTRYPVLLINKKQYYQLQVETVKNIICGMQTPHQKTQGCSQEQQHQTTYTQIVIIVFTTVIIMIAVLVIYRVYLRWKIRRQIRNEVHTTLEQYYRYIQTFQGENGKVGSSHHYVTSQQHYKQSKNIEMGNMQDMQDMENMENLEKMEKMENNKQLTIKQTQQPKSELKQGLTSQ